MHFTHLEKKSVQRTKRTFAQVYLYVGIYHDAFNTTAHKTHYCNNDERYYYHLHPACVIYVVNGR